MNKFKVGDIVTGISDAYSITHHGYMGKVVKVFDLIGMGDDSMDMTVVGIDGHDNSDFKVWSKYFKLVKPVVKNGDKTKCCGCSEVVKEGNTINHQFYCISCTDDDFCTCSTCSQFVSNDDSIKIKYNSYCSSFCANEAGYFKCSDCGEWPNKDDRYIVATGEYICDSCYSNNYFICEDCDEIHHNDNGTYNDYEGEYYCDSCNEHAIDENRVIKEHDFRPRAFVYDKMAWENTIYLGIELEVEGGQEKADKVMDWLVKNGLDKRVYIKEDGSLDDGFEIVIHPTTLQALHKRFPMRKFLAYLKHIGLSSHSEGTCGLHVHISRKELTDRDLWAGKLFFWKCQKQLKTFSARLDKGCDSDDPFNYCKFDQSMPVNGMSQPYGKYSAFNSASSIATAELRLFRGTLQYDRFLASLQFSDCFANYIQETSVVFLRGDHRVVWESFIKYAKAKRRYSQMIDYIKKKGIV